MKLFKKLLLLFKKQCLHADIVFYGRCYSRITYSKKNLKKSDFILGFGYNSDLLSKLHKARLEYNENNPENKLALRSDFEDKYDCRRGYYINGEKINTKIHPLHSKQLMNVKTKQRYFIDTVTYLNYHGKYMSLSVRKEGSQSHGEVLWENISCNHPDFVKSIRENNKKFILVDKFDPFTL